MAVGVVAGVVRLLCRSRPSSSSRLVLVGVDGVGILILIFWGGSACFSVWRARRLWKDPDYYQQVVGRGVFRFGDDVSRGLVRGWAPFSVGVMALMAAMAMFIIAGVGQRPNEGPSAAAVTAGLLLVLFVVGVVLQLLVAWFNRPRWCVPRLPPAGDRCVGGAIPA
ncbi:hypothetical protein [Streptomyces sp. NPDC088733]|uniref:hypothetical protein n=1 Tax=Streptomyces sp. NPDC088733 TaxID=3365880 RepID=UPI00381C84F2